MKTDCPLLCAASLFVGVAAGLVIAGLAANADLIEECQKQHNVHRCVVVAIPQYKLEIYTGASQ